ncbi:MAG: hypothetical protein A2Y67_03330 [Candidatus Buchananbacteria bacterium RBG_13_39_9]|uniref:Uncharacterized protein n=1 Tax=Candidatus Buchananbacteria bacterium RBG_13_39_9 TaxID=1797531 RepID=A0A1G1XSQ6_9BACT|nr:MAG: hypothetical protein A2Y67_03330 [Candidatus Buchananbacteria bacterium RBG_13_39_9]
MTKNVVVGSGSNVTFGLLRDLMAQLEAGEKSGGKKGKTGDQLRAFLEGRNPFERAELEKVLPYADEQTESSYCYPEGFRIRTPQEQVEILLKLFPNLDASHVAELASGELPEWAEGWAVILKPEKVGNTYHTALEAVLGLIANDRKFQNWREGTLTEKHLRLKEKTAQTHAKLNEQPGDFWVFPFQFGKKWAGHSVRNAQVRFADKEFGLGPYEVAILLLTHPDRITGQGQLYIDCAGCEYSPAADGDFFACLDFCWNNSCGQLGLDDDGTDDVSGQWGAASGFLAQ